MAIPGQVNPVAAVAAAAVLSWIFSLGWAERTLATNWVRQNKKKTLARRESCARQPFSKVRARAFIIAPSASDILHRRLCYFAKVWDAEKLVRAFVHLISPFYMWPSLISLIVYTRAASIFRYLSIFFYIIQDTWIFNWNWTHTEKVWMLNHFWNVEPNRFSFVYFIRVSLEKYFFLKNPLF